MVEPAASRVYLTEDAGGPNGLLYRWTAPARLPAQAAHRCAPSPTTRARSRPWRCSTADGSVAARPGLRHRRPDRPPVHGPAGSDVPDRQATTTSLRKQFAAGEVTHAKKLEGAWGDKHGMYFVVQLRLRRHRPAGRRHQARRPALVLRLREPDPDAAWPTSPTTSCCTARPPGWEPGLGPSLDLAFDGPDGCHVSPYGSLILSEDGNTANHLLSWSQTPARRRSPATSSSRAERAGRQHLQRDDRPGVLPGRGVLFVNVQEPGHVFAISGPWRTYL